MRGRGRALIAVPLLVLLTTTGCSDNSRTPEQAVDNGPTEAIAEDEATEEMMGTGESLTPKQMIAEYWATTKKYDLPPGTRWKGAKDLPPAPDAQGIMRGNSYEEGWGTSTAESEWMCHWEREWLAQRDKNAKRAEKALTVLRTYPETHDWTISDQGIHDNYTAMMAKAELSDPSAMAYEVQVNCS